MDDGLLYEGVLFCSRPLSSSSNQTKTKKKKKLQRKQPNMSCTAVSSFYLLIANLLLFAHVNAVLFR